MILTLENMEQFQKVETWLFGQEFPEEIQLYIYVKETKILYAYKTVLFRGKWLLATDENAGINKINK